MMLFSSFFRSRPQEQDARPPLPPRPSQTTTPTAAIPLPKITPLNNEKTLEGEINDDREVPVYDGFESLCRRFEQQLLELQSLRLAHDKALNTIQQLESQLARAVEERQHAVEARRSEVGTLSAQLRDANAQIKQLRSQKDQKITNLRAELHQQEKRFATKENDQRSREKKLKDEVLASSKALAHANHALEDQRVLREKLAQRAEDASRLPKGILQSTFAARFVQPFVLVLIDGDAYKFTHELSRDRLQGGARAAHRIKTEVLNYMATHDNIPLHSKIIVRVFFNAGSTHGKLGKDGIRGTAAGHAFMIQFSETHPLFDFLDCGSGKERADTKIRQNFELFVDNPYCRAVFLAVCYDGGFVRMLEPYQHSEDALNKIVLVKAGQVAPGFLSVPRFQFAEFSSVFHKLYSLKIGSIGKTLCGVDEPERTNAQAEWALSGHDISEPEDLPLRSLPHTPWQYSRCYVRSTATLLGFAYKATLPGAKARSAMPTPELIAFPIASFQFCGPRDSKNASLTAGEKRRINSRIEELESAIQQKQQAAKQPGISKSVQNKWRRTARSLEDEIARLKQETAQRTRSK